MRRLEMRTAGVIVNALVASCFWVNGLRADVYDTKTFNSADFIIGQITEQDSNTYATIQVKPHLAMDYPGNPGDPELPVVIFLYSLPYGLEVEEVRVATLLPALIWNPHNLPSGDSLHESLVAADYDAVLTDDLAPFLGNLSEYHLFILAGIFEHDEEILTHEEIEPFMPSILDFLSQGGSIYWEGAVAFNMIDYAEDDTLIRYFLAAGSGNPYESFSFISGVDSALFSNIDSLGYYSGGQSTNTILCWWPYHICWVLSAPEVGDPWNSIKATISQVGQTHTMLSNFSWGRLHDGYTNTRVDLIHDVMDWLSGVTGVEEEAPSLPNSASLLQNYPNPFNAQARIEYILPSASQVTMEVFNVLGERAAVLIDNVVMQPGFHNIEWNAAGLPSGLYFIRFSTGDFSETKKVVLLK
jgi:hypothetical protein